MNTPIRRIESRYIHVDSRDFSGLQTASYKVLCGTPPDDPNNIPVGSFYLPVQDYNNVIEIELKALALNKPLKESYVVFKIENTDGKVDSTSKVYDATTMCYFENDSTKTTFFGGNVFKFQPPIAKLTKLNIQILKRNNNDFIPINMINDDNDHQSFLLKISYIEGNIY